MPLPAGRATEQVNSRITTVAAEGAASNKPGVALAGVIATVEKLIHLLNDAANANLSKPTEELVREWNDSLSEHDDKLSLYSLWHSISMSLGCYEDTLPPERREMLNQQLSEIRAAAGDNPPNEFPAWRSPFMRRWDACREPVTAMVAELRELGVAALGVAGIIGADFERVQSQFDELVECCLNLVRFCPVGFDTHARLTGERWESEVAKGREIFVRLSANARTAMYPLRQALSMYNGRQNSQSIANQEQPTEHQKRVPKTGRGMTVDQANEAGSKLAKKMGRTFTDLTDGKQAKLIGCSWGTWRKTPMRAQIAKRRTKPVRTPRAVGSTDTIEAQSGEGGPDYILNQLIAEQEADGEPSPLDDDEPGERPRQIRLKRLV